MPWRVSAKSKEHSKAGVMPTEEMLWSVAIRSSRLSTGLKSRRIGHGDTGKRVKNHGLAR